MPSFAPLQTTGVVSIRIQRSMDWAAPVSELVLHRWAVNCRSTARPGSGSHDISLSSALHCDRFMTTGATEILLLLADDHAVRPRGDWWHRRTTIRYVSVAEASNGRKPSRSGRLIAPM